MNRTQKMAWWMVVWVGTGMITAGVALVVLYFKIGFPKAWSGLSFIFMLAGITMFFSQSLTTLILYGKNKHGAEGESL